MSCSCIPHSLSVVVLFTLLYPIAIVRIDRAHRVRREPTLCFSFSELNSGCRPPACWYNSLDCNPISTNFDWFSHSKYITNAYTSSIFSHCDAYLTFPSKRLSQHKRIFFLSNEPITLAPPNPDCCSAESLGRNHFYIHRINISSTSIIRSKSNVILWCFTSSQVVVPTIRSSRWNDSEHLTTSECSKHSFITLRHCQ